VIAAVWPDSSDIILCHDTTLSVSARDNALLKQVIVAVTGTGLQEEIVFTKEFTNGEAQAVVDFDWDLTELSAGTYSVIYAVEDTAGNRADQTVSVTVRAYQKPAAPALTIAAGYKKAELSWTYSGDLGTLKQFAVYGCDENGENRVHLAAVKTFKKTLTIPKTGTQYFVVEAQDMYGEKTCSAVGSVLSLQTESEPPVAVIMPADVTGIVGKAVDFFGTNSTDNDTIVSYAWDFGDQTTGSGEKVSHTYEKAGTYAVTLTVTDESGNEAQTTKEITVFSISGTDASHALATIRVQNDYETGTPAVSGAYVTITTVDQQFETSGVTGSDGTVELVLPLGSCVVSVAANGFVPRSKDIVVEANDTGAYSCEVGMTPMDVSVVDGSLTVREMTRDEIIEAGIDVNAPENQHLWEFTVVLEFVVAPNVIARQPVSGYVNQSGQVTRKGGWSWGWNEEDSLPPEGNPGNSGQSVLDDINIGVFPVAENIYLVIYGQAHWLKEMFQVELLVANNNYAHDITDCVAELELPDGLSLATMVEGAQSETVTIGTIPKKGSEEASANMKRAQWYVCGDKEGEYTLTANVSGLVDGESFSHRFETDQPIKVYAGSALHMYVTADRFAAKGLMYSVEFELKNISDKTLNNVSLEILGAEFQQGYSIQEIEYKGGQEDWQWEDGAILSDHNLEPGESLYGEFQIRFAEDLAEDEVRYMLNDGIIKTMEASTTEIPYTIDYRDNSFFYPSMHVTGEDIMNLFFYDDDFFTESAKEFNPELAYMTMCFAASAFNSSYAPAANYDPAVAGKNARDLLTKIGFEHIEQESGSASYAVKPGDDTIAATIASKHIYDDGEGYTLIAVAVRGGGYEREWHDNFLISADVNHRGFSNASYKVLAAIDDYIEEHEITGNVKFWITGFSRAAATANLTAARLVDGRLNNQLDNTVTLTPDNMYAYCFATPANTRSSDTGAEKYASIFSVVNAVDAVPMVAPADWGFNRFGTTLYLPSAGLSKSYETYREQMYNAYAYVSGHAYELEDGTRLDDFQMKKVSPHWQSGEETNEVIGSFQLLEDDNNSGLMQEAFLLDFLSYLFNDGIGGQDKYLEYYEHAVCDLIGTIAGDAEGGKEFLDGFPGALNWATYLAEIGLGVAGGNAGTAAVGVIAAVETIEHDIATYIVEMEPDLEYAEMRSLLNQVEGILVACLTWHLNDTATLLSNVSLVGGAHYPEVYMAWTRLMQSENNFDESVWSSILDTNRCYRKVTVNCPVDLEIYEVSSATPVLVAKIVDHQVQKIEGSSIMAYVDANGQIVVYLPYDGSYEVKITATGEGELNYSITEINSASGEKAKTSYYAIAIQSGDMLTGAVNELTDSQQSAYSLTGVNGLTIQPSEILDNDDVVYHTVTVNVEGDGGIMGGGGIVHGDFVKLNAYPHEGQSFLGWYLGTELLSEDAEFRMSVQKDLEITAKFTEADSGNTGEGNNPEGGDPEGGDPEGGNPEGGDHEDEGSGDSGHTGGGSKPEAGNRPAVTVRPGTGEESADEDLPFADVSRSDWFHDSVAFVYENGLMSGTAADRFDPHVTTSRAMIVTILWRLEGKPEPTKPCAFVDVVRGSYYEKAVAWAAENGIVKGYSAEIYQPDADISREQMAAILWRYAKYKGQNVSVVENINLLTYDDAQQISDYAAPALQWTCDTGIITGNTKQTLDPKGHATRAQVATILTRFCRQMTE